MLTTDTYSNSKLEPFRNPDKAKTDAFEFAPNLTIAEGEVCGFITASDLTSTYDDGNADGTEVAKVISQYAITTDANGKVSFGDDTKKYDSAPCYTSGEFLESDLTGLDAAAIADLGRVEDGVFIMY